MWLGEAVMVASADDRVMIRRASCLHIGGIGPWPIHFTLVILFGLPMFSKSVRI